MTTDITRGAMYFAIVGDANLDPYSNRDKAAFVDGSKKLAKYSLMNVTIAIVFILGFVLIFMYATSQSQEKRVFAIVVAGAIFGYYVYSYVSAEKMAGIRWDGVTTSIKTRVGDPNGNGVDKPSAEAVALAASDLQREDAAAKTAANTHTIPRGYGYNQGYGGPGINFNLR
jgi:high-affinity K+ transport system ATPase subunit B